MPIPIPDSELIRRVIANAGHHVTPQPRWGAVTKIFAVGSTYAAQLCRDHGFDPDEQVGSYPDHEEDEDREPIAPGDARYYTPKN